MHEKMTAEHIKMAAQEGHESEASSLVQTDALRDDLRQHRIVIEAVRRDDLAAVLIDMDGLLPRGSLKA